jgi:hypothetical protein
VVFIVIQPRPMAETSKALPRVRFSICVSFQLPAAVVERGTSLRVAARASGATIDGTIVG